MKNLKIAVWIFLLWLIEAVLLRFVRIGSNAPELLYVFCLCGALNEKRSSVYITVGIVCGILADILSAGIFSTSLLIYTVSVVLLSALGEVVYKDFRLAPVIAVFLFTFLGNTAYYFLNLRLLGGASYLPAFMAVILPVMFYNSVAVLIINPVYKKTLCPKRWVRRR